MGLPPPGRATASGLVSVREATRHSHGQLEAGFAALPWDVRRHGHLLERLLGVHLPLEAALDRLWRAGSLEVSWPPRRRAHLIRADLLALGRTPAEVAALRPCPAVPLPATATQAVGVLYLLDGATLGGAVIGRTAVAAGVPRRPAGPCRRARGAVPLARDSPGHRRPGGRAGGRVRALGGRHVRRGQPLARLIGPAAGAVRRPRWKGGS